MPPRNAVATGSTDFWRDAYYGQQLHTFPFHEDQAIRGNINHHDDRHSGLSSIDTDLGNSFMSFPNDGFGLDDFYTSAAWAPQHTAPTPSSGYSQQYQLTLPYLDHAQLPAASNSMTTPAASNLSQPSVGQGIRCPQGCVKTFCRPGDYRRHMNKHELHKFKCPMATCDKTFYRFDKVRDHLKQGHKRAL